jgi:formamidopyrimidine-DNA glycosylase
MPELPEVETVARNLRGENPFRDQDWNAGGSIIGHRILEARVAWQRTIAAPEHGFEARIAGQRIASVGRRAKYLVIGLDRDKLVVHLRMSGDLSLRPSGETLEKHDRVVLSLSDGKDLVFNDTRKFGRIWLLDDTDGLFSRLGPEPLGDAFTSEWFYYALQKRKRKIKPLLLDQEFLAGVGNIYADESLHLAGIHPLRIAATLNIEEAGRLHAAIREVLMEGIENNGASIDWVYRGGEYQNNFKVYQREGQPCYNCGDTIRKITVGQRGSHYCPTCQISPG